MAFVLTWSTLTAFAGGETVLATVKTTAPGAISGRIVSLSLNDGLRINTDGHDQHIERADLVRITLGEKDRERGRRDAMLRLRNGDVVHGRLQTAAEGTLTIEAAGLGEVDLPLEVIARIDMPPAFEAAYRDGVRWFDRFDGASDDRLLLTNGDVLRGFVTGLREDALVVDGPFDEMEVSLRLVVSVRFADRATPSETGVRGVLSFRDGTRATACSMDWVDDRVSIHWCIGPTVRVSVERLWRIEFIGGRWEWISEHTPISFEHAPMLSRPWELQRNLNVLGGRMSVGGERFENGVGVHSRSSLIYDVGGTGYSGFETLFGIDDDSGPHADVEVMIHVDGQPRFRLEHVRQGTLHGPVRLDLRGAQRIELLVDFGANGDLQDRFNWIEPALIR